jgi:UDP-N-acetylglucosamine 2-epimerase (non-hydrolysing)/GDP/UDP-N,N'-diacetylbacillosamine 2-epimerase (hydrolysing)
MTASGSRRRVAIFTGNRAEYGLQYPIIKAISEDPRLEYQLLVSGAHLKQDFGRTLREIEENGFTIHAQVRIDMPEDTLVATAQAIGSGVINVSRVLAEMKPDAFVVYADRFESFAAIIAGTQMGIPTAHVEGGDYTEGGALDDTVRHAMTKLAHLHFTTNEQAAERVRRLGEEPWRVFTVGFPALDLVKAGLYAKPEEIYRKYSLDPARPILVFTQHSVTTEFESAADQVRPSLEALEEAGREWGCQVVLTYPNDDAGGRRIVAELETFAAKGLPFVRLQPNLGRFNYHGVLNVAAACLGNSSSGIKETPAFHCPCIDIGSRQRGRLRGNNILEVDYDKRAIKEAIRRCLFDEPFKAQVRTCSNPYGAGNAGRTIADTLATIPLTRALIQKKMTY